MKFSSKYGLYALLLCALAAFVPTQSAADDIDIFVGGSAGAAAYPKILIVLDNTSNWSRASQKWPGGIVQGQAEVAAINTVLGTIGSNVSLGLMEFVTGGSATQDGGYIRQAVVPMTNANKTTFSGALTTIYNNITSPNEKTNSGMPYGDLMEDAWNYFNGLNCLFPSAVVTSLADPNGYTNPYTTFRSPLSDSNACGNNYIIFIGNPDQSGPSTDSAANGAALTALGGSISPDLLVPGFTSASTTISTNLAYTSQCYASLSACSTTDNTYNATQCASGNYASCSCSNTITTTSLDACASGTQRYSVSGITNSGGTTSSTTTTSTVTNPTKGVTGCYASSAAAAAAGDHGGLTLPPGTTTTSGSTTTTTTNSGDTYAIGSSPSTTATQNCAPTTSSPTLGSNQITTNTATTSTCYSGTTTGSNKWSATTDYGGLSCPATSTTTSGNQTTTTTYTCTYAGATGSTTGCAGTSSAKYQITVTQTVTGSPSTTTSTPNYKFDVTQTYQQQSVATTTTGATSTQTLLGNTSQCYASCNTAEFSTCSSYNGGCTCGAPTSSAGLCTSGARYMVTGNNIGTVVTPTGTYTAPSKSPVNADEWAAFMHQAHAINSASGTDTIHQPITTYTIDVFNAQQNADETALYMSMARVGGGKYFAATNQSAIVAALQSILAEIQSVNSTFASASLPVNATNRTQNANQVFIGMFRPDPAALPRWYGNLKQYQIGNVGGGLDLVDANGSPATNTLTGFIADCAVSFWTTNSIWPTNSSNYWANIVDNPDPASQCIASTLSTLGGAVYSDLPDGPTVEKGAVAEVLRKGNDPTATTPTWTTVKRNVLTLSSPTQTSGALVAFNTTNVTSLASNVVQYAEGIDVNNNTGLYNPSTNPYQTRPGIHGDVVHSRPLPINYGTAGVTVYYGANDGTFRAVDSSTGRERWSYIAPEQYSKLQRLMNNSPGVDYHIPATTGNPPKDYFFDGSIGVFQAPSAGTNPPVWIYPTQRRGGRMVYSFDVSDPTVNPTLKWRHGCVPNPPGADICDTGFSAIGQTWSTPNVAFINGYSPDNKTKPVVVMGGGYDPCEDTDSITVSCPSATPGNVVYFIDADTGAVITSFTTLRSVAADVTLIDINNDGLIDYAYVADTGGNIYRIDFVGSPTTMTTLTPSSSANNTATGNWYIHRVAYTNGAYRKFLFGPGAFPTATSAYLAIVSGDREHPLITDYPFTTPVVNRAYVYKDDLTSIPATSAVNLDDPTVMLNVTDTTTSTCTSTNLLTSSSYKGWYMDLTANGPGEQGVTSAVIVAGMVTFSTNRPLSSSLACSTRLGEARGYFVNLFNGSGSISTANNASCGGVRSSLFAGGGLPPSPVIGIVPINGVPTAILIGAPSRTGGANSPIKPTKITPPINQTRNRTYKYIKGTD